MAQVVLQLEFSLQQQDIVETTVTKVILIDASCTNETNLSVGGQPTLVNERIPTSPPKEQPNYQIDCDDLSDRRKKERKVPSYKPSWIRPWDALWNKVIPSRKNENSISEICEEDVYLPKYDWATIAFTTNRFSSSNKIGESGCGTTYEALLPSGQRVAVKRYSSKKRFITELLVVQKLQHPNILKLLGYCVHKENIILVSEFMENKSIDKFLSEGKFHHVQWTQRFKIIMGIARGVAYLHQVSGMMIIHGYLRPSHILLDNNMNPKISGFGRAKTLEEDSSEFITKMIDDTMGYIYICPEYFRGCKASMKADVYSFGVVILEIVSISYGQNIVNVAIDLWKENKALELVDESIRGDLSTPVKEEEVLRCIKVGLLCTQIDPHCRPTMPSVIKLLEGELSMELQELP